MAAHYYGVDLGQALGEVSTGTSTTSKKVEVVVTDGVSGNNKLQVLEALEKIEAAIALGDDVTP